MVGVELRPMAAKRLQFAVEKGRDLNPDRDLGAGNAELFGRDPPELSFVTGPDQSGDQFGIESLRDGRIV